MTTLSFENGEASLSVRKYVVAEALSSLFEVTVEAVSTRDDVALEELLGRPAALRIAHGTLDGRDAQRSFAGVCTVARQIGVEPRGVSIYQIGIAPALWLLTQRTNHRVFQHLSVPEIVERLLAEWDLRGTWRVDPAAHPRLEYRVQYGESDFAFVSRLLAEAGIAFLLPTDERGPENEAAPSRAIVFSDGLASSERRADSPLAFEGAPTGRATRPFVTDVRVSHELRPGRVTLQGSDFRRSVATPLTAVATSAPRPGTREVEARLEHHVYSAGAFVAEQAAGRDAPAAADDRGVARATEARGAARAASHLAAARSGRCEVTFATNLVDLLGTTFAVEGHGHPALAEGAPLLVTRVVVEGGASESTRITATAILADEPFRPTASAPKPIARGVESAVVVGPANEEIHTDELGRVRVQFPWDREGRLDDGSSCWIRVSQGWAGAGFGLSALPRVGQEVVVGFFGGDPDEPVVVGRLFNATAPAPQRLPEERTRSTWRSASSPGGGGWNELTFEDERGRERVYLRAERDLERDVRADEWTRVGGTRTVDVTGGETLRVGGGQTTAIARGRATSVGGDDETSVGGRYAVRVDAASGAPPAAGPTGIEVADRKITLSTGQATITLEGPNITLDAAAHILLGAAADLTITGRADIHVASGANVYLRAGAGELVLEGGPHVRINPREAADDDPGQLPFEPPPGLDLDADVLDAEDLALFDADEPQWLARRLAPGGAWDPGRWGLEHEDFGVFHLGVMAAAAGIPIGVMSRQIGRRALAESEGGSERGDPGNGLFGGRAPYGNTPARHALIARGATFHGRVYRWGGDGAR